MRSGRSQSGNSVVEPAGQKAPKKGRHTPWGQSTDAVWRPPVTLSHSNSQLGSGNLPRSVSPSGSGGIEKKSAKWSAHLEREAGHPGRIRPKEDPGSWNPGPDAIGEPEAMRISASRSRRRQKHDSDETSRTVDLSGSGTEGEDPTGDDPVQVRKAFDSKGWRGDVYSPSGSSLSPQVRGQSPAMQDANGSGEQDAHLSMEARLLNMEARLSKKHGIASSPPHHPQHQSCELSDSNSYATMPISHCLCPCLYPCLCLCFCLCPCLCLCH